MMNHKIRLHNLSDEEQGSISYPAPQDPPHLYQFHLFRWWLQAKLASLATALRSLLARAEVFVYITAMLLFAGVLAYGIQFFWPQTLSLSYAAETCVFNPVILNQSVTTQPSASYKATYTDTFRIAGYPVYSGTTCVTPKAVPREHSLETVSLAPFGNPLLRKNISISSGSFPAIQADFKPDTSISAKASLKFAVEGGTEIFKYVLTSGDKHTACAAKNGQLSCDLAELDLAQAQSHKIEVHRVFNGKSAGIATGVTVKTLEPIAVASSSIAANSTIIDAPSGLSLALNKPATKVAGLRLEQIHDGKRTALSTTFTQDGATIQVAFTDALPRSAALELVVGEIEGTDGSFSHGAYVLPFKTSGGPGVTSINIGSYKVSPSASYTVSFDIALAANQPVADFVVVEVNGQPYGTVVTLSGAKIQVTPTAALPRCAAFTVKVRAGLTSAHGVGGGTAWQFSSHTICQSVFSIGTSVNGRAITAYSFGGGDSKVLFVGATHGDEKSSTATLNALIDYLEAHPGKIPAHRTVVVIPVINPDGYAAGRRTNANNVDLNRNFATYNWKQSVVMPDKSTNPNGGGNEPLSEPESAALAKYTLSIQPRLVLTYHSQGSIVTANESGDSMALAKLYGRETGYWAIAESQLGNTFEYDTTGAYENWLHEKPGLATLLIELPSDSGSYFSSNRDAILQMVSL